MRKALHSLPLPGRVCLCLIALFTLWVFAFGFGKDPVFDGYIILQKDIRLHSINVENVQSVFTENYWWPTMSSNLYRPLTTLSLLFDYSFLGYGAHPVGYQVLNLLLHLLNIGLAFGLAKRLGAGDFAALFATGIFALHPSVVEIVPNIVGRSDLLATLATLGGMHIFLSWREQGGAGKLAALFFCGAAGVLCKESAVILPGLIIWHLLVFPPAQIGATSSLFSSLKTPAIRAVVAIAFSIVILAVLPKFIFEEPPGDINAIAFDNPLLLADFLHGRLTALSVLGEMLVSIFAPFNLSPDYSYGQIPVWGVDMQAAEQGRALLMAGVALCAVAITLLLWRKKQNLPAYFMGAGLLSFLPTANLFILVGTIRADRFMYLPGLWIAGAAGLLLVSASARIGKYISPNAFIRMASGLGAIMVLTLGIFTSFRARDWQTSLQFWMSAYQSSPNSFKTRLGYGMELALLRTPGTVDEANRLLNEGRKQGQSLHIDDIPTLLELIATSKSILTETLAGTNDHEMAHAMNEEAIDLWTHLYARLSAELESDKLTPQSQTAKNNRLVQSAAELSKLHLLAGDVEKARKALSPHWDEPNMGTDFLLIKSRLCALSGEWDASIRNLLMLFILNKGDRNTLAALNLLYQKQLPAEWRPKAVRLADADPIPAPPLNINDPAKRDDIKKAADAVCQAMQTTGLPSGIQTIKRRMRHVIGITEYGVRQNEHP